MSRASLTQRYNRTWGHGGGDPRRAFSHPLPDVPNQTVKCTLLLSINREAALKKKKKKKPVVKGCWNQEEKTTTTVRRGTEEKGKRARKGRVGD